ncbi:hypothetical protein A0H81_03068 [Grifola frondosa]|uniref:Uncharacterized protein n=1 Tax=Grifola frondosa TaxID=5627 RepID=A0A1C7MHJ0_GRIFR|nr:hypothetical protein A0H81_03068 [Grifola frondosa]
MTNLSNNSHLAVHNAFGLKESSYLPKFDLTRVPHRTPSLGRRLRSPSCSSPHSVQASILEVTLTASITQLSQLYMAWFSHYISSNISLSSHIRRLFAHSGLHRFRNRPA